MNSYGLKSGCDHCKNQDFRNLERTATELILEAESSFDITTYHTYFQANIEKCKFCGALWFEGYDEDFTDIPVEKEFGKRLYLLQTVSPEFVAALRDNIGKKSLDYQRISAALGGSMEIY